MMFKVSSQDLRTGGAAGIHWLEDQLPKNQIFDSCISSMSDRDSSSVARWCSKLTVIETRQSRSPLGPNHLLKK